MSPICEGTAQPKGEHVKPLRYFVDVFRTGRPRGAILNGRQPFCKFRLGRFLRQDPKFVVFRHSCTPLVCAVHDRSGQPPAAPLGEQSFEFKPQKNLWIFVTYRVLFI